MAEEWIKNGKCYQRPELVQWFFPDIDATDAERITAEGAAKTICSDCPVQSDCHRYAMDNWLQGTWGGVTESERLKIRRKNRNA